MSCNSLPLPLHKARKKFKFLETNTYLDTASVSLSFDGLGSAAASFFLEDKSGGITNRNAWNDIASMCKERMARLVNAETSEIIFLSNTSEGLNMVANAIDWRTGDEILLADNEFPGNIYPWTNLRTRGVHIRIIENQEGKLPVNLFEEAFTKNTRLLSISHVNWVSGYKIDLKEFHDLCTRNDVLLFVDVCQSLCAVPVDAKFVDFLAGSVFKWPLGPFGLAVLFVNERISDKICPPYLGYGSVRDPLAINFGEPELKGGSEKFQYAHINYPGIYVMAEALALLEKVGLERIYAHVEELTGYLIAKLRKLGVSDITPMEDHHRAGIVSFSLEDPEEAIRWLENAKIHVSLRNQRIRVSPHLYNDRTDIIRFTDVLKSHLVKKAS